MRETAHIVILFLIIFSLNGFSQETEYEEILIIPIKSKPFDWKDKVNTDISLREADSIVINIDSMTQSKLLTKYFYPNMSFCGGALYGYYKEDELIYINSIYSAELGFSSRQVYLYEGKILKIIYREHFAEWEKYDLNHPPDKYEYDTSKMTYSDTLYTITFNEKLKFEKQSMKKLISKDVDSKLIERLTECAVGMREELETEKILEE